jgi:hypothetical protein
MPAKSSGGQYSPRHNSKPRHSAIGRSCDRHDYRLSLSAERKQRDYSNRFGRYRLSERFVAYNNKWFGDQATWLLVSYPFRLFIRWRRNVTIRLGKRYG